MGWLYGSLDRCGIALRALLRPSVALLTAISVLGSVSSPAGADVFCRSYRVGNVTYSVWCKDGMVCLPNDMCTCGPELRRKAVQAGIEARQRLIAFFEQKRQEIEKKSAAAERYFERKLAGFKQMLDTSQQLLRQKQRREADAGIAQSTGYYPRTAAPHSRTGASCSDITGTGGAPSAPHCNDARSFRAMARWLGEQKRPSDARHFYKAAETSFRWAGDAAAANAIMVELAAMTASSAAAGESPAIARGDASGSPLPPQASLQAATPRTGGITARSQAGGDCSTVKENIDWVFRDPGAQRTFAQQKSSGKSDFEAVIGAQAHNRPVQDLLRRCQAVAQAYLDSRDAAGASTGADDGLSDAMRKRLDEVMDDPVRRDPYLGTLGAEERARANAYINNKRVIGSAKRNPGDPKGTGDTSFRGSEEGSDWCKSMASNKAMNNTTTFYLACGSRGLAQADNPAAGQLSDRQPQGRTTTGPIVASQQAPGPSPSASPSETTASVGSSGPAASNQSSPASARGPTALAVEPHTVVAQARALCATSPANSAEWKTCMSTREAALIMAAEPGIRAACSGISDEAARSACAIDAYVKRLAQIAANDNCYWDEKGRQCYPPGAAASARQTRRNTLRAKLLADKRARGQSGDVSEEEVDAAEAEEIKRSPGLEKVAQSTPDWNRDDPLQNYLRSGNNQSRGMLDNSGNFLGRVQPDPEVQGVRPQPNAFPDWPKR